MEYEIVGDTLPVVICHLNKGEKMISDSGAMSWMDPCMKMETNGGVLVKSSVEYFLVKLYLEIVIRQIKIA